MIKKLIQRRRLLFILVVGKKFIKLYIERGPAQDVPLNIILWYIAKRIPTFLGYYQFVM